LFQGQPYRVLWILKILQPPLVLWLAMRAWPCGLRGRIAAIALVGFLGVSDFLAVELAFPLVAFPCFVAVQRGLKPTARRPDWLIRSLVGSLVVGLLAWELLKLAYFVVIAPELLTLMELTDYARMLLNSLGPLIWLGLVLAALTAVVVGFDSGRVVVLPAVAIGIIAHFAAFAVPRIPGYREVHDPDGRDLGFARTYLEERVSNVKPLRTLYAGAWGRVDYLWIHLGVKSYYEWAQVVGALFSRENASEGRRRAELVSRFELDRFRPRERFLAEALKVSLVRLFRADLTAPPPSKDDLVRLCRDEALDVAVLKQDFGDLVAATNGRVFIYECVRVRMAASSEKGA
jgi:hypothetical protein